MLFFPYNKHLRLPWFTKFDNKRIKSKHSNCLIFTLKCFMNFAFNPRRHKGGGGGGQSDPLPRIFWL